MSDGDIEYVRVGDGLHIAYQVQGDGPLDMLEIGGFGALFPLDAAVDNRAGTGSRNACTDSPGWSSSTCGASATRTSTAPRSASA